MRNARRRGRLIVFEGLDGSGKSTKAKFLRTRLSRAGHRVTLIDFPQYGRKSAGPSEEYLNGVYGSAEKVNPYAASLFYACDRYDASFRIRRWLREGKIVIADRYLFSNIGHQGGKFIGNKKAWDRYVGWLYSIEYGIFGIPRPDKVIFLATDEKISRRLSPQIRDAVKREKRMRYLKGRSRDIHEASSRHLVSALASYRALAKRERRLFLTVECKKGSELRSIADIHEEIWRRLRPTFRI